jgi:D-hexose-6-phosphate mutarotase
MAAAIRGGVPLVFPQFGQPQKTMASHGFARISHWALGQSDAQDDVEVCVYVWITCQSR